MSSNICATVDESVEPSLQRPRDALAHQTLPPTTTGLPFNSAPTININLPEAALYVNLYLSTCITNRDISRDWT